MKSQILILKYLYLKSILNISNRHNSAIFQTTIDMAGRCGEATYEERREKVRKFNLTNDVFFCKVMEDSDACREVEVYQEDR